jgi:hypothetical protein
MKKLLLCLGGALLVFVAVPQSGFTRTSPALSQKQSQPQPKTFTGTIVRNGDNFVLSDAGTKTSYVLDDARKASQFEGKKVKVRGTVDVASNTIHVETIEEVA